MVGIKAAVLRLAPLVPLLLLGDEAHADQRPGKRKHTHDDTAPHGTTGDHGHHHRHDTWVTPPLRTPAHGAAAGTIRRPLRRHGHHPIHIHG